MKRTINHSRQESAQKTGEKTYIKTTAKTISKTTGELLEFFLSELKNGHNNSQISDEATQNKLKKRKTRKLSGINSPSS